MLRSKAKKHILGDVKRRQFILLIRREILRSRHYTATVRNVGHGKRSEYAVVAAAQDYVRILAHKLGIKRPGDRMTELVRARKGYFYYPLVLKRGCRGYAGSRQVFAEQHTQHCGVRRTVIAIDKADTRR